jgi:hypothetical protein
MAITGVAFTAYPVTDMSRAVAFYSDTLGLTKAGLESDFWVEFDVAGSTFGVGNFEQIGSPGLSGLRGAGCVVVQNRAISAASPLSVFVRESSLWPNDLIPSGITMLTTSPCARRSAASSSLQPPVDSRHA